MNALLNWLLLKTGILYNCEYLHESVHQSPVLSAAIFFSLSSVLMILGLPRTFTLILAGILFEFWEGVVLTIFTSLFAASLTYFTVKTFGRHKVRHYFIKNKRLHKWEKISYTNGYSITLTSRLIHIVNFTLNNIFLSLLPITFKDYFLGSLLGFLPGTIAIVYSADVLGCAILNTSTKLSEDLYWKLFWVSVALTLISFIPMLIKYLKKKGEV